jgi:hypothetical protein
VYFANTLAPKRFSQVRKLPLRKLDEARQNPAAFRARLAAGGGKDGWGATYFGALRDAIFRFETNGQDERDAARYLDRRLAAFKSAKKKDETLDHLAWYAAARKARREVVVRTRESISISLPPSAAQDVRVSGQIARIDLRPSGGFCCWLFSNLPLTAWDQQLRMPLIQAYFDDALGPTEVGVISFKELSTASRRFSAGEVQAAQADLEKLLRDLGLA